MKKQTVLRKLAELKAPLLQFGVTKLDCSALRCVAKTSQAATSMY